MYLITTKPAGLSTAFRMRRYVGGGWADWTYAFVALALRCRQVKEVRYRDVSISGTAFRAPDGKKTLACVVL